MRIGIDGLHLFGNYAGIQGSLARLVTALRAHAPQDEIVLYTPRDFKGPPDAEGDAGLTVRRTWFKGKSRTIRTLWRSFRLQAHAYKDKCELLHGPTYALPYLLSMPSVVTIHDVIALTHPLFCTPGSAKIQKRVIPRSVKIARRVIVPSIATKDALLSVAKEADEQRIDVIPWGVGEEFKPVGDERAKREARAALKLPERYVLFVGNIEPKKNLTMLINSFFAAKMNSKLPHKLVIAGQTGWKQANIERLVVNLNAREFVLFTGYVEPRTLPMLYALADLFVLPSLVEGFGMPALEAMASGCPVVTSVDAALREVCGSAARMFQYDAAKPFLPLREVFEDLLDNAGERERMTVAGLERAKVFTWERTARLTRECYAKALE
ncbi:MAG TPA: glycosyltransferase family 1 protein [Planctomycetota bacterium]|nr:glycosyltransferase family 1 protein [Planctomycetota bacterium]